MDRLPRRIGGGNGLVNDPGPERDLAGWNDTYLGSRYISSLAPGQSSTEATQVYIPGLKRGTYYIGAIADSNNQVVESNETNNALAGNQIFIKR